MVDNLPFLILQEVFGCTDSFNFCLATHIQDDSKCFDGIIKRFLKDFEFLKKKRR